MGNGIERGCDADCETGSQMSQMLEEEWAGMNEWVPSWRRDWLWDSIRWMMAELDHWAPGPRPRWLAGLAGSTAGCITTEWWCGHLVLQWHSLAWQATLVPVPQGPT